MWLYWKNSAKLDGLTQFVAVLTGTNNIKLNMYQCNKLPHDITFEQKSTHIVSILGTLISVKHSQNQNVFNVPYSCEF